MTDDVLNIGLGTLLGLGSTTIFVLILFIGFCVVVGFTKLKKTAGGKALVVKSLEERVSILGSQVGSQPVHGGEMGAPVGHSVEDGRELTRRAGGVNALAGSLLGEVQLMHEVEVHGGEADRRIEPARVDLGDSGQEQCHRGAILGDAGSQVEQEITVAHMAKRVDGHELSLHGGAPRGQLPTTRLL